MTWHLTFTGPVSVSFTGLSDAQFNALCTHLGSIEGKVDHVLMDEALVKEKLAIIDAATTKSAANTQIFADTAQVISGELDTLQGALAAALAGGQGVSQSLVDQAGASAARAQSLSDAMDLQVPALQAIASKGITNPVPIAIPPVPPEITAPV